MARFMGMYHKNRVTTLATKREAKKQTSKGMRRAAKKSCTDDSVTLSSKSKNLYGFDSWKFS